MDTSRNLGPNLLPAEKAVAVYLVNSSTGAPVGPTTPLSGPTRTPRGYVQITGLATAKALTPIPTGATMALIVPEDQPVRWRDDGEVPTAVLGMPAQINEPFEYTGNLSALRFIESAAGARLNVSFY